ncbi:MAG TPA: hypothetical protein VKI65_15910 [Gemmataceae bacterium]|nr:hypothetical protein [Gemmataceae bacterium]
MKLLFGPYKPPTLRRGQRAFCLARDCDVVITGWTAARILWPRCRAFGTHGGGSGILVDTELARAVRHESAAAVRYWWGVGTKTIAWWRRALGVGRADPEGSRRLIRAASLAGTEAPQRNGLPETVCARKSERSRRLNLIRFARRKPAVPPWTRAELRLLGTAPDDIVAAQIGRTATAVRVKRTVRGIPNACDRRRKRGNG